MDLCELGMVVFMCVSTNCMYTWIREEPKDESTCKKNKRNDMNSVFCELGSRFLLLNHFLRWIIVGRWFVLVEGTNHRAHPQSLRRCGRIGRVVFRHTVPARGSVHAVSFFFVSDNFCYKTRSIEKNMFVCMMLVL